MLQHNLIKKPLYRSYIQRLTFFEYLYVSVLVIYAGNANIFTRTASLKGNVIGFLIPVLLSVFLAMKWNVQLSNRFYNVILGLGIYFIAISIKYQQFHITIFINYLGWIFTVYAVVKALKFNLFKIYEYLIYHLAIIGLIMWCVQFILGGDTLLNLFSKIPGISSFSMVTGDGLSTLLYTIQPSSFNTINNSGSSIPRNCGFAWEAGAFAVYLCLAIFINLFITNSDKKSKVRFWVFVSALLTTQSTTGFVIFIVIMLFFYANKKLNIILLTLPIILTALVYIISLPFMGNKIIGIANEINEMEMIVENSIGKDVPENPQRFVSFMIGFQDFLDNPILGISGDETTSWTKKIDANINVISGLGNLLAQNGIIGLLFFMILSFKTSSFFSEYYNYKGKSLLFIIILFLSISYTIIFLPLIMCFWMFSFFEPRIIPTKRTLHISPMYQKY